MKININNIPLTGLTLFEEFTPQGLDLETEVIKFRGPIKIKAIVSKISDAVMVYLDFSALMLTSCSRCLNDIEVEFKKNIELNYPLGKLEPVIDTSARLECHGERSRTIELAPDIRDEIILDYPVKPLCKSDCKGLCPKCGRNLNEGKCGCDSKK